MFIHDYTVELRDGSASCYRETEVQLPTKGKGGLMGCDTDDWGPQRWSRSNVQVEACAEEGYYIDRSGTVYEMEDIFPYRHEEDVSGYTARKILNSEESSWMKVHEHLLENINEVECVSYNEEISLEDVNLSESTCWSTDRTELTMDEFMFWRSMVWYIGHAPTKALEVCKKHKDKEWFNPGKKAYIWGIIREDNKPLFKYAQFLMMSAKQYVASHEQIMEHADHDVYEKFSWKITDSYKYPGQKFIRISFDLNGVKHTISKVSGCSNWITDLDLDNEKLNIAIDLARKEYIASK